MRTVVHGGAHMVTHGRNLDIVATVGAFDGGQEAHVHSRHSRLVLMSGEAPGGHRGVSQWARCPDCITMDCGGLWFLVARNR